MVLCDRWKDDNSICKNNQYRWGISYQSQHLSYVTLSHFLASPVKFIFGGGGVVLFLKRGKMLYVSRFTLPRCNGAICRYIVSVYKEHYVWWLYCVYQRAPSPLFASSLNARQGALVHGTLSSRCRPRRKRRNSIMTVGRSIHRPCSRD
jgi:hypothetical protein